LAETLDMFQKHGLPLPIGAYDQIVKGEREFDQREKARKAAVTRVHLFDEHTRMTSAEEVNKAIAGNGIGANIGRLLNSGHLLFLNVGEDSLGFGQVA
jgi:hypothetical protein